MVNPHNIRKSLFQRSHRVVLTLAVAVLLAYSPATARPTPAERCGPMCQFTFWRQAEVAPVRHQLTKTPDLWAPGGPQGGSALNMAAAHTVEPAVIGILLDAGTNLEYRSGKLGNTPLIAAAGLNRTTK